MKLIQNDKTLTFFLNQFLLFFCSPSVHLNEHNGNFFSVFFIDH